MAKDPNIIQLDQFADLNPGIGSEGGRQYEVWCEENRAHLPDGPGRGRAMRLAELEFTPTPDKPRLLRHHVEAALELLRVTRANLSNPAYVEFGVDRRLMIKDIRAIPSAQRERLDPVFEHSSLWADGERHQRRFDQWELDFTDTLDSIDAAEAGGRGKFKRLYSGYVSAMEAYEEPLAVLYRDMLDALGGTFWDRC